MMNSTSALIIARAQVTEMQRQAEAARLVAEARRARRRPVAATRPVPATPTGGIRPCTPVTE